MSGEERRAFLRSQPRPEPSEAQQALHDARVEEAPQTHIIDQESLTTEAPRFTLSISGPSNLTLSGNTYLFTATLTYISPPSHLSPHDETTVIFDAEQGPLRRNAPQNGRYSLYTSASCEAESRVPYVRPNVSIRAPREPDGRFKQWFDVIDLSNHVEVKVGSSVSREVELNLGEGSNSWRKYLVAGQRYWLRGENKIGRQSRDESGIDRFWRLGKLAVSIIWEILESKSSWFARQWMMINLILFHQDLSLPLRLPIRDPNYVAIPLEPSNTIEIEILE